ncbi:hypothetical protein Poli38472_007223 [Pythium oligandrum]|uniref:Uncharacterized protein n=1 Tax=Pythium oligandrum TaxID=41045 RepID=A0A8K1CAD4_PYTOL|nr:hypothetical protein Poli38472_007223 [Pythium oligandrum]|eukprot:TMW59078.1 hypothetical protein Poli38472_007223 [Pythium oligandrum]
MTSTPPRPAPKLSLAQTAILRAKQIDVRGTFLVVNALLLLLVFYTSLRFPHKYVRVKGECESNWLRLDAPVGENNIVCCGKNTKGWNPPCHAGMGLAHELATFKGAWVLPLTTLIFNYGMMMLGPNAVIQRVRVCVRRGVLYFAVMSFRTVVLYLGFNRIEAQLVALFVGPTTCWYSDLRRNKRCAPAFDHSDHIVLLVSHYFAISLFEWFALTVEIPTAWSQSVKKTFLIGWITLLLGTVTYTLIFTATFFHSPLENLFAVIISQVFIMTPLYLLTQDYFVKYDFLRLRHFVLPPEDVKAQ